MQHITNVAQYSMRPGASVVIQTPYLTDIAVVKRRESNNLFVRSTQTGITYWIPCDNCTLTYSLT